MKAIDGFDLECDVRFSSYATPTVLGELRRHFRDRTWAVHVPRGLQELQIAVAVKRDELSGSLGRSPTVAELADAVGAPFASVLESIQSAGARRSRSLDEPVGEDGTIADQLGGDDPELARAEMRVLVRGAMRALPGRHRQILRMRFENDLTQAEIASRVGLSQMQVSRIIRDAITRLRREIERRA